MNISDNIVMRSLEDLIPYVNNPRQNDDAVDAVAASIKEFGFKIPLVIDNENVVVCGHTRLKAAKKLHLSELPCIVADVLVFFKGDPRTIKKNYPEVEVAELPDMTEEETDNLFD